MSRKNKRNREEKQQDDDFFVDPAESNEEGEENIEQKAHSKSITDAFTPIEITRSYSRKLNMAMHGGQQYETMDIGETRTARVNTHGDIESVAAILSKQCMQSVEDDIKQLDAALSSQEQPKKRREKVQQEDEEVVTQAKELAGLSEYVNKINKAKTVEELKEVAKEIKSAGLDEKQMNRIREIYEARKADLLEAEDSE